MRFTSIMSFYEFYIVFLKDNCLDFSKKVLFKCINESVKRAFHFNIVLYEFYIMFLKANCLD